MSEDERPVPPRRGPRTAEIDWRRQILDAARQEFGERGYQGATMRRIGQAAGVDPKLVHYYFGKKDELFAATIAATFRARGIPDMIVDLPQEGSIGTRYLRAVLMALEDDTLGPGFIGLIRNLGTHEESRRIFLRFVTEEVLAHLAPRLQGEGAQARMTLAGSQLLGLVMVRYVLQVPPLATLPVEEVARLVGPNLDRYLYGDMPLDV